MAYPPQYASNHTIDPETGFLESKGYVSSFDAERKLLFFERLKANGLALYKTAKELGISYHTINKHYQQDPQFKKIYDQLEREYADELESVSRINALNPRSVIERIFQLKALLPNKYADQKNAAAPAVVINIDTQQLSKVSERQQVIDVEEMAPVNGLEEKPT